MEATDELLTIAELAIGIAGFSGVIAAFLQRGGLHPFDRFRFVNLFTTAFAALVLAFVPFLLGSVVSSETVLWQIASGTMIGMWSLNVWFTLRYVMPLIRKYVTSPIQLSTITIWALAFVNLLVQVTNAFGLVWAPGPEAYVFGLLVYLVVAGFYFVYIILWRPDEDV